MYRIATNKEFKDYEWLHKEGQQYRQGIKFNLLTGECINPEPDMMQTIIPEKRAEWLRDLKRFKRGMKSRAKVGALQGFVDEAKRLRAKSAGHWAFQRDNSIDWKAPACAKMIVACMQADEYPPELLQAFVTDHLCVGFVTLTEHIDEVCKQNSVQFRAAYGVFGKPKHVKK
jgi:hypothetical protein